MMSLPRFMAQEPARLHELSRPGGVVSSADGASSRESGDHQDIDYLQAVALTERYHEQNIVHARAQLLLAVEALMEAVVAQRQFDFERAFDDDHDLKD